MAWGLAHLAHQWLVRRASLAWHLQTGQRRRPRHPRQLQEAWLSSPEGPETTLAQALAPRQATTFGKRLLPRHCLWPVQLPSRLLRRRLVLGLRQPVAVRALPRAGSYARASLSAP